MVVFFSGRKVTAPCQRTVRSSDGLRTYPFSSYTPESRSASLLRMIGRLRSMLVRQPPKLSTRPWTWLVERDVFAVDGLRLTVPEASPRPKMLELGPRLIS